MDNKSFTTSNPVFVEIMREKGLSPSSTNTDEGSWTFDPTPAFNHTLKKVLSNRSFDLASGKVRDDR
jgi:hypothetical protein